jgi:hypothetical protein
MRLKWILVHDRLAPKRFFQSLVSYIGISLPGFKIIEVAGLKASMRVYNHYVKTLAQGFFLVDLIPLACGPLRSKAKNNASSLKPYSRSNTLRKVLGSSWFMKG